MNTVQNGDGANTAGDGAPRWMSTEQAAPFLGMSVRVLRDTLTKHAKTSGEMTEARFDGILGRRVGRRWKVWLSEKWTAPQTEQSKGRGQAGGAALARTETAGDGGKGADHACAN